MSIQFDKIKIHTNIFIICILTLEFIYSCQIIKNLREFQNSKLTSITNSIGMELLEVPKGEFQMGCRNSDTYCDEDELPARKTEIQKPFYLGKYEVTRKHFSIFVKETSFQTNAETSGSVNTWKNCHGIKQNDSHPVICITWIDAVAFTKWLSQRENKKYRLPSEAEWEYAASGNGNLANMSGKYFWGSEIKENYVWYNKNSDKSTQPVGTKKANSWGFFDMAGNVWEWCSDDYDAQYFKRKESKNMPPQINENKKVLRGGSWFDSPSMLRLSARLYAPKNARENNYGFRILLEKSE